MTLPNVGDVVKTPRFCHVTVSEVFASYEEMIRAGFTESAHLHPEGFELLGKNEYPYITWAVSPPRRW